MASAMKKAADTTQPIMRIAPGDLNNMLSTLDVTIVALSECLVSPGHRLELGGVGAPGLHYNIEGVGKAYIDGHPPIALTPHTLIIVPPDTPFKIEVEHRSKNYSTIKPVPWSDVIQQVDGVNRMVAGEDDPEITLICGFFQASYGATTNLFAALGGPIIEQFDVADRLDDKLKSAMSELISQEVGSGAMSGALLKQVILAILRRSLNSINLWVERFAILSDPRIARAFSDMASDPGANHTVESLAEAACLSRSAFMSRFSKLVGNSPMIVLRDLRMRQAAQQLRASHHNVERIASLAGYASRSSFVRAFKEVHGLDPTEYRAKHNSVMFTE